MTQDVLRLVERREMDKQKALDSALAQIERYPIRHFEIYGGEHFERAPALLGRDAGGGRAFDAPSSSVMVVRSYVGGPADRAGVKPGDLVIAGESVVSMSLSKFSNRSLISSKKASPMVLCFSGRFKISHAIWLLVSTLKLDGSVIPIPLLFVVRRHAVYF